MRHFVVLHFVVLLDTAVMEISLRVSLIITEIGTGSLKLLQNLAEMGRKVLKREQLMELLLFVHYTSSTA